MSIDPRIDPKMPNRAIVQRIADILRDYGPIQHNGIAAHLPQTTGLTTSYITYVLKKLRAFGMAECVKKGYPYFVWKFVAEGEVKQVKPKADKPVKSDKVMLKHMGSYRVKTHDGRSFDRMEFHRSDLTWSNRTVTLDMDEISHVAFVPDHAAYKSGTRHLDIYAHPYSDIDDCIIPKLKPSDDALPKWVHPIRAKLLGIDQRGEGGEGDPLRYREQKKDFGSPFK